MTEQLTRPLATTAPAAGPRGGVGTVWRWEVDKLGAQWRTRLVLAACAVGPWLFAVAMRLQTGTPQDTVFGRWVHDSGYAIPLVVLGFCGQWALPALICVVAGDIFSSEDHHGTWQLLVTRSPHRRSLLIGKVLAGGCFAVIVVALLAVSSLAAGLLVVNSAPLVDLSGLPVGGGRALGLVLASWASVLLPALALTAVALLASLASRRATVGIGLPVLLGLVMQLLALLGGPGWLHELLLPAPLSAWHGLWTDPAFHGPLVRGAVVSLAYATACLVAAAVIFARRPVEGTDR